MQIALLLNDKLKYGINIYIVSHNFFLRYKLLRERLLNNQPM